jgi:hypothetical protein
MGEYTKRGEFILWPNHLHLLVVLFDMPNKTVSSRKQWARLTRERFEGAYHNYLRATRSFPGSLVSFRRVGSSDTFQLNKRGEDVLRSRLPVWIHGMGPYHGVVKSARSRDIEPSALLQ